MAIRLPRCVAPSLAVLLAAVLAGCGNSSGTSAQQSAAAPPPPEVGVVTVATGDVGLVTELPGRLEPSRVAQVRARAAGIV
jgi:membrane fusion protein (multidrug efflux system)